MVVLNIVDVVVVLDGTATVVVFSNATRRH